MGTVAVARRTRDDTTESRRASRHRRGERRRRIRVAAAGGGIVAVALLVLGVWALAADDDDGADRVATPTLELALGDYFIAGDLEVPAGPLILSATNVGVEPHDVGIRGVKISGVLFTGDTAELDVGVLEPGTYELFCDISDHVERGMVATLIVTEPAVPADVTLEPCSQLGDRGR